MSNNPAADKIVNDTLNRITFACEQSGVQSFVIMGLTIDGHSISITANSGGSYLFEARMNSYITILARMYKEIFDDSLREGFPKSEFQNLFNTITSAMQSWMDTEFHGL